MRIVHLPNVGQCVIYSPQPHAIYAETMAGKVKLLKDKEDTNYGYNWWH